MEAVLKIGGSLLEDPSTLVGLCKTIGQMAKAHRIVVIPGGGEFADLIRKIDENYKLSNTVIHKMAILAMDQYGLLLSNLIPNSYFSYSLEKICKSRKGILPIFLPSKLMFQEDPLPHSWDVTSDTIAGYIAKLLNSKKLILVTDVNGIFSDDPKQNIEAIHIDEITAAEIIRQNKKTSIDKRLPYNLLETKIDCYVVNGKYPKRIKRILMNKKTICTHIKVEN